MNLLAILEKQKKPSHIIVLAGFVLTGLIGIVDFLTGYEIAFSVFYVFPIALVTWLTSQWLGLATSLGGVLIWGVADAANGYRYSHPFILVWNTLIRLAFFAIITLLLSAIRKVMQHEKELACTDYLTGAVNSRLFYELTQMEIERFQRYGHPFTLAYMDLDDFKAVNDQFGHTIGDLVLFTVATSARKCLRKTDVVARLGGDEFALLLPETDQISAQIVISKLQNALQEEMRSGNWPTTFSIGVLTCSGAAPLTTEELVGMADRLMYSVKCDSKNAIKYSMYLDKPDDTI